MSEDVFLQELVARLEGADEAVVVPPGDDCAALALGPDLLQLLAVDQVVGDRHYHLTGEQADPPGLAGRKLLARNLSDIAAMGGTPAYALVAVALDPGHDEAWLNRFLQGIIDLGAVYNVRMIGGDLARTPADNVASLTIVGTVPRNQVCCRKGARPGDALYATGWFGASLETRHHLNFSPRCAEGRWLAASGAVTAMIDVSDGLLLDATRLCRASGLGLLLDTQAIPPRIEGLAEENMLGDGEDYELLVALDPEQAGWIEAQWPFSEVPLTRIGTFEPSQSPRVRRQADGVALDATSGGYDHFRGTPVEGVH